MSTKVMIDLDDDLIKALDKLTYRSENMSREDVLKDILSFILRRPPISLGGANYQAAERWDVGSLWRSDLHLIYVLLRSANGEALITTLTEQEAVMMADGLNRNAKLESPITKETEHTLARPDASPADSAALN